MKKKSGGGREGWRERGEGEKEGRRMEGVSPDTTWLNFETITPQKGTSD